MTTTSIRPIAMRYNAQQLEKIRPILEAEGFEIVDLHGLDYLCNYQSGITHRITDLPRANAQLYRRKVFETWDEDTFLQYCGITSKTSTTYSIPIQDVLRIHEVACPAWKQRIAREYLPKVTSDLTIEFSQEQVTAMFDAATITQKPVLESIFGVQALPIDFSKLKTGSIVKIKYTGQHIGGIENINIKKPVTVVLFGNHTINPNKQFDSNGRICLTFFQGGNYCIFAANEKDREIDYITQVISY